ncbi:MAG: DUF433 domain-containing protein [Acidobacteriota bacterium]|nr:DUF433 domain-containing protein [Acidobacteriota bacterium]
MSEYITKLETGAYRIADTRVSLDSVVYAYKRGELAEAIVQSFPSLTLAQVHGAIAFYLSHREMIDEYLRQGEIEYENLRQEQRAKDPELYARFEKIREQMKQKV